MEEKKVIEKIQNVFNEDGLDILVEDGIIENETPVNKKTEKPEGIGADGFTMRTWKPYDNLNYITQGSGGWSTCIQGYPTDWEADVLANCVGYASGRFNEIINIARDTGGCTYGTLNCNAENFVERAQEAGLEIGSTPRLGAIMCWAKGSLSSGDGAGHVAIVERVDNNNQVYTSESAYGGTAFFNSIRTNDNGRWGMGSAYWFRCFIYLPDDVQRKINGGQPTPPSPSGDTTGLITYQSYDNDRGTWLPEVYGSSDYAGIYGDSLGCVKARPELGEINIQVHTLNGTWLPYVNSNNYYDGGDNSYAGIYGVPIDGVRCYSTQGYVSYRVHIKGGDWLPWVTKADDTSDGYAGIYGYEIDAIQMY